MSPERLNILVVTPMPASPPRFGAQARMHGLMASLGRRHDVTAISLIGAEFDEHDCRRAMEHYCKRVVLVPDPNARNGIAKRMLQLRSLASLRSFEYHRYSVDELQRELDCTLSERFDVVHMEFPYLSHFRVRQSPIRPAASCGHHRHA